MAPHLTYLSYANLPYRHCLPTGVMQFSSGHMSVFNCSDYLYRPSLNFNSVALAMMGNPFMGSFNSIGSWGGSFHGGGSGGWGCSSPSFYSGVGCSGGSGGWGCSSPSFYSGVGCSGGSGGWGGSSDRVQALTNRF